MIDIVMDVLRARRRRASAGRGAGQAAGHDALVSDAIRDRAATCGARDVTLERAVAVDGEVARLRRLDVTLLARVARHVARLTGAALDVTRRTAGTARVIARARAGAHARVGQTIVAGQRSVIAAATTAGLARARDHATQTQEEALHRFPSQTATLLRTSSRAKLRHQGDISAASRLQRRTS